MSDPMLDDFHEEAIELYEEAETSLLSIDKGEDFNQNYNCLFRAFHSLKGAAGMFGLDDLQAHMHHLENLISEFKAQGEFSKDFSDYLFKGIDAGREILNGKSVTFEKKDSSHFDKEISQNSLNKDNTETKVVEIQTANVKEEANYRGTLAIVDDEEEIVDFLTTLFEKANYNVHGFTNGMDLLQDLEKLKLDLVLSDYKMPEIDGISLMKEVHKKVPLLPVILISGFLTKEHCINALAHGVNGIIEKPFDNKNIISQALHAMRRYQSYKLLNRSIDLIVYQFSDFEQFLIDNGKKDERDLLRNELKSILEFKKNLTKAS